MAAYLGIPEPIRSSFGLLGPHSSPPSDQTPPGKDSNVTNEHFSTREATVLFSRWFFGASQAIPDFALFGTLIRFPIYVLEIYNFASHSRKLLDESEE